MNLKLISYVNIENFKELESKENNSYIYVYLCCNPIHRKNVLETQDK